MEGSSSLSVSAPSPSSTKNLHSNGISAKPNDQMDSATISTSEDFSKHAGDRSYNNNAEVVTETPAQTPTTKKSGFLGQFSARTKYVLALCSLANLLASCAFSLLAPFYPLVAERKQMSLTMIGFVFSVFQLVIFLTSPIVGTYLTKIGTKFVYMSGIFIGGSCVILFGLLDRCPDDASFIAMSLLCRSVEALGCAMFITASFAIISNECRSAIGSAYAILETSSGVGFMIGPAVGGALYELGGYGLPFYAMGSLILANGILIYNFLPQPETVEQKRKGSMVKLLRSPLVIFSLANVLQAEAAITVFDSTFAKHMGRFGLSAAIIGLFFVIPPALYAIVAPFWGYLTDHKNHPKTILIVGNLIFALGYLFMGPSPLLLFIPSDLWVITIGLLLVGFSFSMLLIPSMKLLVVGAHQLNYEASLQTYALISGLFNSVHSFGGFLGPMLGGVIVQEYGHPVGYTVVSCICIFMMAVGSIFFLLQRRRGSGYEVERAATREGSCGHVDEHSTLIFSRQDSNSIYEDIGWMRAARRHRNDSTSSNTSLLVHLSLGRSISIPDNVY